jgi:hypothetical protein
MLALWRDMSITATNDPSASVDIMVTPLHISALLFLRCFLYISELMNCYKSPTVNFLRGAPGNLFPRRSKPKLFSIYKCEANLSGAYFRINQSLCLFFLKAMYLSRSKLHDGRCVHPYFLLFIYTSDIRMTLC